MGKGFFKEEGYRLEIISFRVTWGAFTSTELFHIKMLMLYVGYLSAGESLKVVNQALNQPEDAAKELVKYNEL